LHNQNQTKPIETSARNNKKGTTLSSQAMGKPNHTKAAQRPNGEKKTQKKKTGGRGPFTAGLFV